ncbi:MAG: hypothetical protein JRD89_20080, partial [Deltaproteobacteria bacterium]|nr:hypothetical protein [Deltaproteobacteria bacterium]
MKWLMERLHREQRGQVLNVILTIVVAGIALMIGLYVFSSVQGAIPDNSSILTEIANAIYNAFSMAPIILIVLVASAIIGVLLA